jgi:hypothetical protein
MAFTSMIKRLWNDRRGAAAWVVTVAMVPLLGLVSLGTEVGSWHVIPPPCPERRRCCRHCRCNGAGGQRPHWTRYCWTSLRQLKWICDGGGCPSTATPVRTSALPLRARARRARVTAVVTQYESRSYQWFVAGPVKVRAALPKYKKSRVLRLALREVSNHGPLPSTASVVWLSNGTFDAPPRGKIHSRVAPITGLLMFRAPAPATPAGAISVERSSRTTIIRGSRSLSRQRLIIS